MVFGNVKGALSMAAVLALPANIPYRERLVAIVFGVTLVTLVTQALPFRAFLTWLGVAGGGEDELAEECRAILIGARRAQAELDSLLASGLSRATTTPSAGPSSSATSSTPSASCGGRARTRTPTSRCPPCSPPARPRSSTPRGAA